MFGLRIPYPAVPGRSHWQLPNTFMVRKCSLANIGAWPSPRNFLVSITNMENTVLSSSLSRGLFVDSHNRRVEREGASGVLREVAWPEGMNREKTRIAAAAERRAVGCELARHGPGLMMRDLRACDYRGIFFVIEFLPYSARLIAARPHQSFINWPSHKKFSLVSIINNAISRPARVPCPRLAVDSSNLSGRLH